MALLVVGGAAYLALFRYLPVRLAQKGTEDAARGVVNLAELLHDKQITDGKLPPEITPNALVSDRYPDSNFDEEWPYRHGHFDRYTYSIQVEGKAPAYEGTRIKYDAEPPQGNVVLVVRDLSRSEWDLTSEEVPDWWQFWQ